MCKIKFTLDDLELITELLVKESDNLRCQIDNKNCEDVAGTCYCLEEVASLKTKIDLMLELDNKS